MICSFEKKETRPDGSYIHSKCIRRAEILLANDPCYGLCYACAYEQLQAKVERLEEFAKRISNGEHCGQKNCPAYPLALAKDVLAGKELGKCGGHTMSKP
ncbi:MAG: hypothetical protein ACYS1A_20010 [Planctomycetota bacterium]